MTKDNLEKNENKIDKNKQSLTRKQEVWNLVKFVLFSISAGAIQLISYTILSQFIFKDTQNQYGWSYFIALVLSVLWNFTFNRKFTFKSANNVPIAMSLTLVYYAVFTPLSILWGDALVGIGWNDFLVLLLTMIINMATEFLWQRFVIYRKSINTADMKLRDKNKKNYKEDKETEKE